MLTPFDAVLKVLGREMERLQRQVEDVTRARDGMRTLHEEMTATVAHEQQLTTVDWQLFADAYLSRARAERSRLSGLRREAEAELAQLRRAAADHYAKLQAIGAAAEQFRAEQEHARERAEQQMVDDVTAARVIRAARAKRQMA